MTRRIRRRIGSSAAGTRPNWRPRSALDDALGAAQVLDDRLAERERRAPVEVAGHGGASEKRPERREVAAEALEQPVPQLLAGGRAERGCEAATDLERVDALALRPGLDQGEAALHASAVHRAAVDLVQLAD